VVDQIYSIREENSAINVDKSAMITWARKLKNKHNGYTIQLNTLTPDQCEIKSLRKRSKGLKVENKF